MLAEELLEDLAGGSALRRAERGASEQEARGGIHDGERINQGAIAGAELAFEVDAPDVVGLDAMREGRRAGHEVKPALAAPQHTVAREDLLRPGLGGAP